ncbi:MAG: hypothetical protein WC071_02645, partial [Victivallaceae bacterium]
TIGCPWFRTKNVPRLAYSIKRHNAEGMCLTSWNTTRIDQLKPELIRALALTAYYSWSPDDCDLEHLKFVPDAITEGAAYWNKVKFPAVTVTPVKIDGGLTGGNELVNALGLPDGTDAAVIGTPFKNYRGVTFDVFQKDGKPAAVMLRGVASGTKGMVNNGDFSPGFGINGWNLQNAGKEDIFETNGVLKIIAPQDKKFMRAYQDIALDPKKSYSLVYKVKADVPGTARVWLYSGDEKFKWDAKILNSNTKNTDWMVKEVQLPPGSGSVRICFSAEGAGTAAYYDDIKIVEAGAIKSSQTVGTSIDIPVDKKARVVTFMHATSKQILEEDMAGMGKKFANSIPGQYIIVYSDGSNICIPLFYRVNIAAANDMALGRDSDVGLFGTVGYTTFLNIPTFTWANPYPAKTITSIKIVPGNSKDMSLLLFGISLD